jgi:chromate transporter
MRTNEPLNSRDQHRIPATLMEILAVSLRLGVTSFGGPIAHLGYFHKEYVHRRKWLDDQTYASLVALCQFLPGPASSQVGISIGVIRGGLIGGLLAWIGFTLPSILVMVLFASLLQGFDVGNEGWVHGLKIVAVAIVAQAILSMRQKLIPDRSRAAVAIIAASLTLIWQTMFTQVLIIIVAGLFGLWMYRTTTTTPVSSHLYVSISRTFAIACLVIFLGLLVMLPLLGQLLDNSWLVLFDSFYRSGSLVFGGGHVVLPLLERELVPTGWISQADFLAGYGAAQAVPGPLFTFAAYLGAMTKGVIGAIVATIAIFLPAFLLVIGVLPFWNNVRRSPQVQGALLGINAAVVGLLLAALYNPLWTSAIVAPTDMALVIILFMMLVIGKLPPWIVVIAGTIGGVIMAWI